MAAIAEVIEGRVYMGLFIAIEGIEGSGKSSLIGGLRDALDSRGVALHCTREPGATALGLTIRSLLLAPQEQKINPIAEVLLFFADRAQHVAEVIKPNLERGSWVLCDRFSYSTLAYQGYGRGLNLETLLQISEFTTQGIAPDLVVLLDLPAEIGLARAKQRSTTVGQENSWTRFEAEELSFHTRIRDGFLQLASKDPERWLVVDAQQSPEHILESVLKKITSDFASNF